MARPTGKNQFVADAFVVVDGVAVNTEQTIWTPGSGKRIRLLRAVLSLSASGILRLRAGTGGTVILSIAAGTTAVPVEWGILGKLLAVDQVLTATSSTVANLHALIMGQEE